MPHAARLVAKTNATGEVRVALRFGPIKSGGTAHLSVVVNPKTVNRVKADSTLQSGFGGLPAVTVFTRLACSRIREGAAIVERDYGKRCLFVTGTLPGGTPAAMEAISRWSGYIIERLNQWFRDLGGSCEFFSVWERQKRGALHLHSVFASQEIAALRIVQKTFKTFWIALLHSVSRLSGVDLFQRANGASWKNCAEVVKANARPIRKSIRHYLSKYLSKNVIERCRWREDKAGNCIYFPSRWWSMCGSLKAKVKSEQKQLVSNVVPLLIAISWQEACCGQVVALADNVACFSNPVCVLERTVIAWHNKENASYLWDKVVTWWSILALASPLVKPASNIYSFPKRAQSRYKNYGSLTMRCARVLGFVPS